MHYELGIHLMFFIIASFTKPTEEVDVVEGEEDEAVEEAVEEVGDVVEEEEVEEEEV